MIEIYRCNSQWRIRIVNETLEFKNFKELEISLIKLLKLKESTEPYNNAGGKE